MIYFDSWLWHTENHGTQRPAMLKRTLIYAHTTITWQYFILNVQLRELKKRTYTWNYVTQDYQNISSRLLSYFFTFARIYFDSDIYLFVAYLTTLSLSQIVASTSNCGMVSEHWTGKYVEGSGIVII
jgi:hypothetical protein